MAELTLAAGLPRPEIDDAGGGVTVRFRHELQRVHVAAPGQAGVGGSAARSPGRRGDEVYHRQQAVLAMLDRADGPLALREIVAGLAPHADRRRVRQELATLKSTGLVVASGHGRGARWRRT